MGARALPADVLRTSALHDDTLLVHAGSHPREQHGAINPPVYHASTIAFPTLAAWDEGQRKRDSGVLYGRFGTPTSFAFEEAVTALEGGYRAATFPSGLAACATALQAFVKAGDHVLVADTVYGPTRNMCERGLATLGVETTFYDPLIGAGIAALVRPNTRAIYMESPGSLTFEMQDVPAIVAVARERGLRTIIDNTWATPYYFKPLGLGVDVSIHAATKYLGGHSDILLGVAVTNEAAYLPVRDTATRLGLCAGPDDLYLALRGLRTLAVRLERHQASALTVASWLAELPEVEQVLYPALPGAPGYDLWRRDCTGASGLFAIVLHELTREKFAAFVDGLELFAIGASWGGFESLVMPVRLEHVRTASAPIRNRTILRLHVGLENPDDLMADLAAGFERARTSG